MVRYLRRLKSSRLGRAQAFPMYGGLGMSAPSLHRESNDSLIKPSVAVTSMTVTSISLSWSVPNSTVVSSYEVKWQALNSNSGSAIEDKDAWRKWD